MKEFHPSAAAIDRSGHRTHYLLKSTAGLKKFSDTSPLPALLLDEEGFREYVRNGRVQMFQDFGAGPTVCYTEEEEKLFGKIAKKARTSLSNQDDAYWAGEVIFYDEALNIDGGISIAVVACRKMTLVPQVLLQGAVYIKGESAVLHELVANSAIVATPTAKDFYLCNWSDAQLMGLIERCKDSPMTICTSTMENLDSPVYRFKMPMFVPASQDEIDAMVRRIGFAQPPVPQKPRSNNDPAISSQYQFFVNNAHKMLGDSFDGDVESPELIVAVVTCDATSLRSSYATVEQLALEVSSQGWQASTSQRLCESPVMGIMMLVGWREGGMHLLANTAYFCGIGSVKSIHVYRYETRELIDAVEFPASGGIKIQSEHRRTSSNISRMNLG